MDRVPNFRETPPADEGFEILHIVSDEGVPMEGWLNKETGVLEKVRCMYEDGSVIEEIYDPQKRTVAKHTLYDSKGAIIQFEDLAALEQIEKAREKMGEKISAFPSWIITQEEINTQDDMSLLEAFKNRREPRH